MTNMEGKTYGFCLREGFCKHDTILGINHFDCIYMCSDFLITLQLVDCPALVPHPSLKTQQFIPCYCSIDALHCFLIHRLQISLNKNTKCMLQYVVCIFKFF